MTELKTFNDIINIWAISQGEDSPVVALKKMTRHELINHIKSLKKEIEDCKYMETNTKRNSMTILLENSIKIDWIMMFFNIKNEDLK